MSAHTPGSLAAFGLEAGCSQVLGAFRIVPILRRNAPGDLRIGIRKYDAYGLVGLDSAPLAPGTKYLSRGSPGP